LAYVSYHRCPAATCCPGFELPIEKLFAGLTKRQNG